jgi:indole-3-glycerol phosphate synthase
VTSRKLSQAISEGDGISVIVEVRDPTGALRADEQGAEGIVLRRVVGSLRETTTLPLLAYGPTLAEAVDLGADAVVISAADESDVLVDLADGAAGHGIECVVKVRDENDLERALEHLDPEIFLLSAEDADDGQAALERLLELLPDIPAGKLAIADLGHASREEIEQLEHAGVDAVLVAPGDVEELVGDTVPDV